MNGSSVRVGGSTRDGTVTRGGSESPPGRRGVGLRSTGSANGSASCAGANAVAAWARSPTGSGLCIAGAAGGGEKSNADEETRAFCRFRLNRKPMSRRRRRMAAAETDETMAVTGTDFLVLVTGIIVGRTVWTVAVTRVEVGLPDIWMGVKVTIAVVVVNELVVIVPRLNAVEVEKFVVLGP